MSFLSLCHFIPYVISFLMSFFSLCFLASNEIKQAEHIAATNPNTAATLLDVQSDNDLDSLVKEHSLVVRWVWL